MSPSEKIRARANDIGVTQAEIRREMERRGVMVSAAAVSLWMSGGRLPSGRRLEILCEVLAIYGRDMLDLCAAVAVWEAPND